MSGHAPPGSDSEVLRMQMLSVLPQPGDNASVL